MDPEAATKLRAAFPPNQVGKLPRVWCKACSANKQQRHCDQHNLVKCDVCHHAKITEAHLHLDYVGHAAVTDRLLQVDPDWTWWPMALDERGAPMLDSTGGLWIMLKVCGVQRPGYGDQANGKGAKEVIGDAIRNAAMRFGVGLDLWSKETLTEDQPADEEMQKPLRGRAAKPAAKYTPRASHIRLLDAAKDASVDDALRHRIITYLTRGAHTSVKTLTDDQADKITAQLAYFQTHRAAAMLELEKWEAKTNE